jgi:hypothetical protein
MPKLNLDIDFEKLESLHSRALDRYVQMLRLLYSSSIDKIAKIAVVARLREDRPFLFADLPAIDSDVNSILTKLSSEITDLIDAGTLAQWMASNDKNDSLTDQVLEQLKLSKQAYQQYYNRNDQAYQAYKNKNIGDKSLSEKVWNIVIGQFKEELEMSIDIGLLDGRSAAEMARDIKKYLNEPEKLFRRVRDERGELHLSKHAKAYSPGQGVYRSSFKNAFRLTRSQINMSYRNADLERWQQLDFIIGYEVKLSGSHQIIDICDELKGIYPKWFKFAGWHPACMCYAIPVMSTKEDFIRSLKGEKVKYHYVNKVPVGFNEWISDNTDRVAGWKSKPYFIKENFKNGEIANGLLF